MHQVSGVYYEAMFLNLMANMHEVRKAFKSGRLEKGLPVGRKVKHLIIEGIYLSPQFRKQVKSLAHELGHEVEFLNFQWPTHQFKEGQFHR